MPLASPSCASPGALSSRRAHDLHPTNIPVPADRGAAGAVSAQDRCIRIYSNFRPLAASNRRHRGRSSSPAQRWLSTHVTCSLIRLRLFARQGAWRVHIAGAGRYPLGAHPVATSPAVAIIHYGGVGNAVSSVFLREVEASTGHHFTDYGGLAAGRSDCCVAARSRPSTRSIAGEAPNKFCELSCDRPAPNIFS